MSFINKYAPAYIEICDICKKEIKTEEHHVIIKVLFYYNYNLFIKLKYKKLSVCEIDFTKLQTPFIFFSILDNKFKAEALHIIIKRQSN